MALINWERIRDADQSIFQREGAPEQTASVNVHFGAIPAIVVRIIECDGNLTVIDALIVSIAVWACLEKERIPMLSVIQQDSILRHEAHVDLVVIIPRVPIQLQDLSWIQENLVFFEVPG